jgi:hypothetical protein
MSSSPRAQKATLKTFRGRYEAPPALSSRAV